MQITVWSKFLKRRNSMKRPTDAGTVINCTLKENCSVMNPIFELGSASYGLVEYVKWENNYYFVTDITMGINNYVIVHCTLDVLATWKDQILTNTAFVAYSSSNYDVNIVDHRIAQSVEITKNRAIATSPFSSDNCIIVTTVSQIDGVASYALTTDSFYAIMEQILGDQGIVQDLQEMFGGVNQGMVSAIQVPLKRNVFPDALGTDVLIGTYNTQDFGYRTRGYYTNRTSITIPWGYNDFRRCSEYTQIELVLPFIGTVAIEPDSIMGEDTINIHMVCSAVTGNVGYSVSSGNKVLGTYNGTFGRQIPLASSQTDIQGAMRGLTQQVSGAAKGVFGGATGNAVAGLSGAVEMCTGVANTWIALSTHNFTTIGGMGGNYGESLIPSYELIVSSRSTVTDPDSITATNGRPCFKELALNTLTGYVETIGFSFETNAISQVRDKINQMMDEGVFIE